MSSFIAQIRQQIEQIEQRKNLVIRKVALEAFAKVQAKSPVDTGALRRSWTVSVSALPTNFNGSNEDIAKAKFGDVIYIATNLPYAPALEYGLYPNPPKNPSGKTKNGYSIQAPQGMVRITVKELKAYLARNPTLGLW